MPIFIKKNLLRRHFSLYDFRNLEISDLFLKLLIPRGRFGARTWPVVVVVIFPGVIQNGGCAGVPADCWSRGVVAGFLGLCTSNFQPLLSLVLCSFFPLAWLCTTFIIWNGVGSHGPLVELVAQSPGLNFTTLVRCFRSYLSFILRFASLSFLLASL